jgi:hypothetical protein
MQPRSLTHEIQKICGPRAAVHPKVAQERLGHSAISLTLDLYSHVTPTMQEDAAVKIGASFRDARVRSDGAHCGRLVAISTATAFAADKSRQKA